MVSIHYRKEKKAKRLPSEDIEVFTLPNLLRKGFPLKFPLAEWTRPSLLNQYFPHDIQ